jgi:hypothetical protein
MAAPRLTAWPAEQQRPLYDEGLGGCTFHKQELDSILDGDDSAQKEPLIAGNHC